MITVAIRILEKAVNANISLANKTYLGNKHINFPRILT